MIIPRPYSEKYYEGTLEVSGVLTFNSKDEKMADKAIELFNIYIP